jgi:Protein of unknown function (DUF2812)
MSDTLVKKLKWFWAWQDDKEEAWLGEMARQGFHLHHAGHFCRYTFVQGAPREVVYRLDFTTNARKKPDYFQLFQDAGWEHVGENGGWQYWRKEVKKDEKPEIYTDAESKIQKYQRLLVFFTISIPLFIAYVIDFTGPHTHYQSAFFAALQYIPYAVFFVLFMSFFFAMFMFLWRISELKRK